MSVNLSLNGSPLRLTDVKRSADGRVKSGRVSNGNWILKIKGDTAYCHKIPGTDHWVPLVPGTDYVSSFKIETYEETSNE